MGIIIIDEPPPPPPKPKSAAGMTDTEWAQMWRYAYQHAQARVSLMYTVKRWFKSRTLWFNALVGVVLGVLVDQAGNVKESLGEYGAAGVTALIVGNAVYRFITIGKLTK